MHDVKLTVYNTSIKDSRPSPFNQKFPLFKLKAPRYICSNLLVTFISNLWSESISDKEIVRRICSLNEHFGKT